MTTPLPEFPSCVRREDIPPSNRNHTTRHVGELTSEVVIRYANGVLGNPDKIAECNTGGTFTLVHQHGVVAVYSYEQPLLVYYSQHKIALFDYQYYSNTTRKHQGHLPHGLNYAAGGGIQLRDIAHEEAGRIDLRTATADDLMQHLKNQREYCWRRSSRALDPYNREDHAKEANQNERSMQVLQKLVDYKIPIPEVPKPESFFTKKKYTTMLSEYLVNGTVPPWQITDADRW